MNAFLRFSVAVAAIAVSSAHAGVVSTFIPSEPTIESPSHDATDVSQTPRFEASTLQATDSSNSSISRDVDIQQSEWLIYEAQEGLTVMGGATSTIDQEEASYRVEKKFDFPFDLIVFDKKVATFKVSQLAGVTFYDDLDNAIAHLNTRIAYSYNYIPQGENALVIIKSTDSNLRIQWKVKNTPDAPINWESDIEVLVTDNGVFGIRLSNNDTSSSMFNITEGGIGCALRTSSDQIAYRDLTGIYDSLSNWKSDNVVTKNGKFSLACYLEDAEATYNSFSNVDFDSIAIPELQKLTGDTALRTLTELESLKSNTKYNVLVRYTAKETSDLSETPTLATSPWSEQINFKTKATDLTLQISISDNLNFIVDEVKDFTMTITNNNAEVSNPTAQIILPFDFTKNINGSLSDFFSASIDGGNCAVGLDAGQTTLSCIVIGLAPGASATLRAKATMPNANITQIQYKVCETAFCSSKTATSVPVTVTTESNSNDDSSTAEGSSGGSGGSLLWIFAALPLLRRRGA
ncbi:MAG: hypothetical protein V7765_20710 [Oleispira sp.]